MKTLNENMENFAVHIDETMNGPRQRQGSRPYGFILMVFPFADAAKPTRVDYISNASREGVIELLRDQLARLEAAIGEPMGRA